MPSKKEKLIQQYSSEAYVEPESDINFRNLPWLSTKADVEKELGEPYSYSNGWAMLPDYNAVNTDGYGLTANYFNADISVSGYLADVRVSYMYPISEGIILNSDELAMLYWAEYTISNLGDATTAASDLYEKLKHIYGDCVKIQNDSYTWMDKNGNCIRMAKYTSSINIVYYFSESNELHDERKKIINAQRAEEEEQERIKNQNNYDGL